MSVWSSTFLMQLNSCRPLHRPTPCVNLCHCHLALVLSPHTQRISEPIYIKTSTKTKLTISAHLHTLAQLSVASCVYFTRNRVQKSRKPVRHHAKEHKGEDLIRGYPDRHSVHVHSRGDRSLGCVKPQGEHCKQYL